MGLGSLPLSTPILPLVRAGRGGGQCLAFLSRVWRRQPAQAGSAAPQPRRPPSPLRHLGKCNGAADPVDLPGGPVAPGRYGEWWLWAGEVELAVLRRRLCCLCADRGQGSNPAGFSGPVPLQLGYRSRASLGCFVESRAELGLGCGLLTSARARAPGVGALGGRVRWSLHGLYGAPWEVRAWGLPGVPQVPTPLYLLLPPPLCPQKPC